MNAITKFLFLFFGRHSVDGVLKSFHKAAAKLDLLEELKNKASIEFRNVAVEMEERSAEAANEAERAKASAQKIRDMVG